MLLRAAPTVALAAWLTLAGGCECPEEPSPLVEPPSPAHAEADELPAPELEPLAEPDWVLEGDAPLDADRFAAGAQHACLVDDTGHVYCWGDNAAGQLGDGSTVPRRGVVRVPAIP